MEKVAAVRCFIFLFIFFGQPAGIGFLVAAKSILRFEEAKEQKLRIGVKIFKREVKK